MRSKPLLTLAIAGALGCASAVAQQKKPIRIGVLNDRASVYADYQGEGSVIAAQFAVQDFGARLGVPVEVVSADHQNKPDVGAAIARKWIDTEGVDVIMDLPNSAVAFAVNSIVREKNKVLIASGAGSAALTGAQCSPNTVHWTYDTYALGTSLAKAIVAEGGKKWFFITADYAFGKDLEKAAADPVVAAGGQVIGSAKHPVNTSDFSSLLLQAQNSGADVVGIANAGDDTNNTLKQAAEFGVGGKQRLAGLILNVTNMPSLGLKNTQGVYIVTGYYWDLNDETRAFAKRYQAAHPRKQIPNDMQAGMYAATLHYLKAVEKVGSAADGKAVVDAMKAMPTDDPIFGKGTIRPDGRKLHPMYLFTTKKPEESKDPWDVFKVVRTIPVEQAWRPLSEGGCPFLKQ